MASKPSSGRRHNCAIPYICTKGAEGAIEFYKKAFGAVEIGKRYPWEGKVGHAEVRIEGALVMLADEFPDYHRSPTTLGGTPFSIHIEVRDVDKIFNRAVDAGAKVLQQPKDEEYGRICKLRDPFGHEWMFNAVPQKRPTGILKRNPVKRKARKSR